MKKINFLLLIVLFVAVFLRFYQLGQNPPSLTWDEAAWGYNAYSLGIDGKDEFGKFLPLDYLESFGDFKPPMYAYLTILPVKIFGLNEFAVRFPSAFLGTLTVVITYFLVLKIFSRKRQDVKDQRTDGEAEDEKGRSNFSFQNQPSSIALLTSFLLAISPWHINLSRAAFEANVATFFIVSGVWLFLEGIGKKKTLLILSSVSFVMSVYTFNSARIVAPILIFILVIAFRKNLLERKRKTMLAVIVGILVLLPTFKFLFSPQASLRFKEVNIFSDLSIIEKTNQEIANDNNVWWSKILHNRRFAYGREYLRHYFDNLSPDFLFVNGDGNPKFSTQDVGELYLWELPFLVMGALLLFKRREGKWWLVPIWLIVGIMPAATARETPHALRIESTLPTFQILTAFGLIVFLEKISKIRYQIRVLPQGRSNIQIKYLIYIIIFSFSIFNFLYYYHGYYAHYPKKFSGEWQYGYKESISYVQEVLNEYDQVNITDKLGRPYIYYLFYTKTNPNNFRVSADVKRESFGFVTVNSFNKFHFSKSPHNSKSENIKILYVNVPQEVPGNARILKVFNLLDNNPSLVAYTL